MSSYCVPDLIGSGRALSITVELDGYPAPTWSGTLYLRGPAQIDITSTADATALLFAATAVITTTWTAGEYSYQLSLTDGSEVTTVEVGRTEIFKDLSLITTAQDARTHAKKVLEAIEAVLENRASTDQMSYQINNRQLSRMPIKDLLLMRDRYALEVKMQGRGNNSLINHHKVWM